MWWLGVSKKAKGDKYFWKMMVLWAAASIKKDREYKSWAAEKMAQGSIFSFPAGQRH